MNKLFFITALITTTAVAQISNENDFKDVKQNTMGLKGDIRISANGFEEKVKSKDSLNTGKGQVISHVQEKALFKDKHQKDSIYSDIIQSISRFVIGGQPDYSPDHSFVVKDGSAMIEGNLISKQNIGIGTNSFKDGNDSYRLSVEGKIRVHAIKVYTDWADYVFEEDYDLPSLDEVEKYIITNGHLKDIPSAEEVENNGVELGELNKLLLQKIEELTLYTIDLRKDFERLKSKLEIYEN